MFWLVFDIDVDGIFILVDAFVWRYTLNPILLILLFVSDLKLVNKKFSDNTKRTIQILKNNVKNKRSR